VLIVVTPTGSDEHFHPRHPERPERLAAVRAGIADLDLGTELVTIEAEPAALEDLTRVHSPEYLQRLEAVSRGGGGPLDADTYATAQSWDAARRAAGGGAAAIAALREHGRGVAFVAARPPGHHAVGAGAMGFCLLNNVAVAAASLTAAGERVVIVDWDVHHGNGTQDIFWDDPDVLYVSTHQSPLYPGTGMAEETGGAGAPFGTVNVPLPAGATGDVVRRAFDEVVAPAVARFGPTWVLVSAGFDAHRADPLADLSLSSGDFARLAGTVAELAPAGGRLVLFLEGGYDIDALRASVSGTLGALVDAPVALETETAGGPGAEWVRRAADVQARG
jgi:acetoin utilization deacetylase AcuC-like enzyme